MTTPAPKATDADPLARAEQWLEQVRVEQLHRVGYNAATVTYVNGQRVHSTFETVRDLVQEVRDLRASLKELEDKNEKLLARMDTLT